MPVLLEVKNISKSYEVKKGLFGGRPVSVLHDINLQLQAGEILAIVGESGSGKSTLARQLVMLEQPDSGEIFLDGNSFQSITDIHRQVRMIFQNPAASLDPRKRVYQLLEEPLINLSNLPESKREELIYHTLDQVGLNKDQASRYPHMFSGGQRQRIAIARALIVNPRVIVSDEAVSALDVSVQAQILNLVMDLRDQLGMSWLFITHDISVVNVIADRVLVIYAGRVMESGSVNDVLENPAHPYTRRLLQSVPGAGDSSSLVAMEQMVPAEQAQTMEQTGCAYRHRCLVADEQCAVAEPPMICISGRSVACFKEQVF